MKIRRVIMLSIFLLIFSFLILLCNTKVFAESTGFTDHDKFINLTYDDITYSVPIPNDYDYYVIYAVPGNTSGSQICFRIHEFSSSDDLRVKISTSDSSKTIIWGEPINHSKGSVYFNKADSSIDVYSNYETGSFNRYNSNMGGIVLGSDDVYTNFDLYDINGNLVFQAASQGSQVGNLVLAPIVEEQETEKTLLEIIQILPIVLVVIVSLIAIRKAIAWLMARMKQA